MNNENSRLRQPALNVSMIFLAVAGLLWGIVQVKQNLLDTLKIKMSAEVEATLLFCGGFLGLIDVTCPPPTVPA